MKVCISTDMHRAWRIIGETWLAITLDEARRLIGRGYPQVAV